MLAAWGERMHRRRFGVVAVALPVVLVSVFLVMRGGMLTTGEVRGTESWRAQAEAERWLGEPGETAFELVVTAREGSFDEDGNRAALMGLTRSLTGRGEVAQLLSPFVPGPVGERLLSPDRRTALVVVTLRGTLAEASRSYPALRKLADDPRLEVTATGHLAFMHDLDETLREDLRLAELVSLPLALIVLIGVFGGLVAASLPVVVGGLSVLTGMGAVLALSHQFEIAHYAMNVVSLIGLGVAIDYSLFIVARYRDERRRLGPGAAAMSRTLDTAGRAVAFSGLAVCAGLSGLGFFRGSHLFSMGVAGAVVVGCAVLFSLTLLPALLSLLDPWLDAGRLPMFRAASGVWLNWRALADGVMRRPLVVLVPTLALLVLLALPFGRLELAAADIGVLPAQSEARRGLEQLHAAFPGSAGERVVVVVESPSGAGTTPERLAAAERLAGELRGWPGVLMAMVVPTAGPVGIQVGAKDRPGAVGIVKRLRERRFLGDSRLLVGGPAAGDLDASEFVRARAPRAVLFVVLLTYVILLVLLGSVLLPLKAVLMNALSLTASFGAMVWIFQEGHLQSLLAFEPRPLEPALPVLLFCLMFGLSMDYEVLLLTRMREEYLRTRDNRASVAEGLEQSAGLITSAAAIMVAVFAAFALARVVLVKAMGVGLALAVLLDATLVRVLLVPATMRLFGDRNWWAPRRFVRLLAHSHRSGPTPQGR